MSLIDPVLAELPAMRAMAESLMLDVGSAKRPTGTAYDPEEQGQVVTYDPDFGFSSRCKLQARALAARAEDIGGRTATTVRLELHLPVDTEPLAVGDVWTFTDVAPVSTAVVGPEYRVTAPVAKTFATARRYEVEAVVA